MVNFTAFKENMKHQMNLQRSNATLLWYLGAWSRKEWSFMTANQIALQRSNEESRANRNRERETTRHNLESESLGRSQLSEAIRHNVRTEDENAYHNRMVEGETNRSNRAQEDLARSRNSIASREADSKSREADTRRAAQEETARENREKDFRETINTGNAVADSVLKALVGFAKAL